MSTYQEQARGGESSAGLQGLATLFRTNIRQYSMLIALIAITLFFQVATDGKLLTPLNITNVVLQNSYIVIMALGMLLVIVAGHIDLSVGSVAAFTGALAAVMMVRYQLPYGLAVLASVLLGALIGAWQGFWVAFVKIPAFIVTLAGMLVFRGLTLWLLAGQSVGPFPVEFQRLSSGFIPDLFGAEGTHITTLVLGALVSGALIYLDVRARANQRKFNFEVLPVYLFVAKHLATTAAIMALCFLMASYKGLPNVLIVLGLLSAVYSFVTDNTVIGRRIYALGGNEKAAKLSGVRTARLTFYTFVNMGVLAALAGMVFAARLNSATPKAGNGFELDVIAACFIGGASASGGVGTVVGAIIGAFVMGVMNNGMSIVGISVDWQQTIKGLVLLAAVFFDVYNKNKS
jgi:putative multiple sugar transport system permease protein